MGCLSNKKAVGCALAGILLSSVTLTAEWNIPTEARVVAVADIHGAYGAFEEILSQAGLVDDALEWAGGDTRLVIVGDVLDRGSDSREALDLIMRLEGEAAASGGGVHLVLGNHELMNLTGDLRYVAAGEYAAFAGDETPEMRDVAFERFVTRRQQVSEQEIVREDFDRQFPAGFFAHRAAFASDGVYGRWLLALPLLAIVGDSAFVHGGISDAVVELGAEGVNTVLLQQLVDYVGLMERLTAGGLLDVTDDFYEHSNILEAYADRVAAGEAAWPAGLETAATELSELNYELVFAPRGPAWYRGTVGCSPLITQDRLMTALEGFGVDRVVVGHTPTPDPVVMSRLEGAVLRIDTGMLTDYYGGRAAALNIDGAEVSVLYQNEAGAAAPTPQPRRVGSRPAGLNSEALEALLSGAEIVEQAETETGTLRVRLTDGNREVSAEFIPAGRGDFMPDLVAYRLDRLLNLEMVPVTVSREIGGRLGSLQFAPPRVITEIERQAQGSGGAAWCPLADQFPSMYIFDILTFNEGRTPDRIRYSTDNFQLILVGHDNAFSTGRNRPRHLAELQVELGLGWRNSLEGLDEASLTDALGLDRRRARAILQRRDALLASGL